MAIRDKAKKLVKWITSLEEKFPPKSLPNEDRLLDQFIHYLIFYANLAPNAKRAFKTLQNENEFGDWNELRVATINEINAALDPKRVEHSAFLARNIQGFLEGIWQVNNVMSLDKLKEEKVTKAKEILNQIETRAKASMYGEHEERRGEPEVGSVIPSWAPSYLLTFLGIESNVPWDPHTARIAERLKLFDSNVNLVRRKKQLRALVQTDREALHLHHLFVEFGKKFCLDRNPKCTKCPLKEDCDYFKKDRKNSKKEISSRSKSKAAARKTGGSKTNSRSERKKPQASDAGGNTSQAASKKSSDAKNATSKGTNTSKTVRKSSTAAKAARSTTSKGSAQTPAEAPKKKSATSGRAKKSSTSGRAKKSSTSGRAKKSSTSGRAKKSAGA
jgi:hypothetical protein